MKRFTTIIGTLALTGLAIGSAQGQTLADKVNEMFGQTPPPAAAPVEPALAAPGSAAAVAPADGAVAEVAPPPLTAESINNADMAAYLASLLTPVVAPAPVVGPDGTVVPASKPKVYPSAAVARLQVLLDQAGASPGVIDGFMGDNVTKAIMAAQTLAGLPADGKLSADLLARLDQRQAVIGVYTITDADIADLTAPTPADYAEKAQMKFLGYSTVIEELAERFHMDEDFLKALNPNAQFVPGEQIEAVVTGANRAGVVAKIDADKKLRQVRAYDAAGTLLAAYPATIGSEDNPSPSGTYTVVSVTPDPGYTYNPKVNFQQGDNTEVLQIPPGPNGPVGSMWIALSKPTFGIHGTPEPSKIDKTGSHGCIRLTNWDAGELAGMVSKGVVVTFLE